MPPKKIRQLNPLLYLFEPFERRSDFFHKRMFGCEAAYLDSKLVIVLAYGEEPWNGILVATDRAHHPKLLAEFSALTPHAILGKWLYLSGQHEDFESIAPTLIQLALRGDPRIGVEPKPRKSRQEGQKLCQKKTKTK